MGAVLGLQVDLVARGWLLFRGRYRQGVDSSTSELDAEDDEKFLLSDSARREAEEKMPTIKYKHSAGNGHVLDHPELSTHCFLLYSLRS